MSAMRPFAKLLWTRVILPAKAREHVFTGFGLCVCLCVFLYVTTITKKKIVDGFVPHFMGRFLGGREDQVRVTLRPSSSSSSSSSDYL